MSTLLEKAEVMYKNAMFDYNESKGQEAFISISGFCLQQSIELAIKYLLGCHDVIPKKTHELGILLEQCRECSMQLPSLTQLGEIAHDVSDWEARGRYEDESPVDVEMLQDVIKLTRELLDYALAYKLTNVSDLTNTADFNSSDALDGTKTMNSF